MKKYTKEELLKMDAVDVYKLLLANKIGRFPNGFWSQPEALQNAIKCTKFLIKELLGYSEDDVRNKFSFKSFRENCLSGMLVKCFNSSPYEALNAAYPGKYQPWELNSVPGGYWESIENGISATRWLLEEKLNWSDEDIKNKLTLNTFRSNGLRGMLDVCFNSSPYEALNATYPGKFHPWELSYVPNGYWDNVANGISAVRWLLEEKLNWSDEDIKKKLSNQTFVDNGLCGMTQHCFNASPYEALNAAYPDKFHPWELSCAPNGIWNDIENGIKATRWLIEGKLGWSDEDIKNKLSKNTFSDNGLRGMLSICFNNSPYEALNAAYPGKFNPDDLKFKPRSVI